VQTKNPRRHREGTCKQVQGIRAQGARASTTRSLRHTVTDNKQDGKHTNEGKVRAGRCRVRANREDMQCKHPGQAKCDPRMARTSAVWASSPGSCPKTWSCSRTCQAHNLLPSTWLQNVLARAIFHRLRLSEMVEKARTDAPERAAACPSTMPCGTAIQFRTCINRPCQRPGPLLAPSLSSSHCLHSSVSRIPKFKRDDGRGFSNSNLKVFIKE